MSDELWMDEALTLMEYAGNGWFYPLTHYNEPNNHVLFSILLSFWQGFLPADVDVQVLRLLPMAFFLPALVVVFFAGRRIGGGLCGTVAVLLFASSSVSANFATQLRGYAPSWLPFALVMLCAPRVFDDPRRVWRGLYLAAAAIGVALLPSNLFLLLIVAGGFWAYHALKPAPRPAHFWRGLIWLAAAPFAGLIAYVGIWRELLKASHESWGNWHGQALFGHWGFSTISDFTWLLPLLAVAVALLLWRILRRDGRGDMPLPPAMALVFVVPIGTLAWVVAMPVTPLPRTLVPLLPVWYVLVGILVAYFVNAWPARWRPLAAGGMVILVAGLSLNAPRNQPCGGAPPAIALHGLDLCHQFHRMDYHPARTLKALQELQSGQPPRLVMTEAEGRYALSAAARGTLTFFDYQQYADMGRLPGVPLPLVVANGETQMELMVKTLGFDPARYALSADMGHFKIYVGR